jgi:hypothetical protein
VNRPPLSVLYAPVVYARNRFAPALRVKTQRALPFTMIWITFGTETTPKETKGSKDYYANALERQNATPTF